MEPITASAARKLMTSAPAYQLEGILIRITGAAQRGHECISLYVELSQELITDLEARGFEVKKNAEGYLISWRINTTL